MGLVHLFRPHRHHVRLSREKCRVGRDRFLVDEVATEIAVAGTNYGTESDEVQLYLSDDKDSVLGSVYLTPERARSLVEELQLAIAAAEGEDLE